MTFKSCDLTDYGDWTVKYRTQQFQAQRTWAEDGIDEKYYVSIDIYFLVALFLTSSSLQECNIILFGCPGVIPEWPLDQS
jgi:hypothetical protein